MCQSVEVLFYLKLFPAPNPNPLAFSWTSVFFKALSVRWWTIYNYEVSDPFILKFQRDASIGFIKGNNKSNLIKQLFDLYPCFV